MHLLTPKIKTVCMIFVLLAQVFTSAAKAKVVKNINYAGNTNQANTLNVYYKKGGQNQDVVVFIHGGSWNSGKKETYWWLGRNFANKNVVTAVINYPLAPNATYKEMAMASAQAVQWVKNNISSYGGNPNRIFLMGHSAGGHLCELINADSQYFTALGLLNPIKGIILNDAFGLDMEEYLTKAKQDTAYRNFLNTFSSNPKEWRAGSPLFYSANINNPHLIFYGEKTYEAIQIQSERIYKTLKAQNVPSTLVLVPKKTHVAMISQMVFGHNSMYKSIIDFLAQTN